MPVKVAAVVLSAGMLLAACGNSSGEAREVAASGRSTPTAVVSLPPLKDAATLARAAGTPKPVVVTADMREACAHVQAAIDADRRVDAQGKRDWATVEAEMYAAFEAGRDAANAEFVRNLVEPGSLLEGDTHTLGDATFRLAVMCGIPVPGPDE